MPEEKPVNNKKTAALVTFSGQRTLFHLSKDGKKHIRQTYGHDLSKTKTYHFNSLGFRGDEYKPDAQLKVFVSGSSYAFGIGLNQEQTWPQLFTAKIAASKGITGQDTCLMNFSEGGASNDYVARMAVTQCQNATPNLLVAEFVFKNRSEGFNDGQPYQIGPWLWLDWLKRLKALKQTPKHLRPTLKQRLKAINHYYNYYNDELGFLNILKNMLLVQNVCQARKIPYLLVWTEYQQLNDEKLKENPVLSPLLNCLDRRYLCDFGIADPEISVDHGADDAHPGPQSQEIYTSKLFDFYQSAYSSDTS
jgi:hypothetical protein